jgi:hypothetical protein
MNCQYMKNKINETGTGSEDGYFSDNCREMSFITVTNFYRNGNVLAYMCVCVCIHIHTHTHTHTHTYIYIYTHIYVHVYVVGKIEQSAN